MPSDDGLVKALAQINRIMEQLLLAERLKALGNDPVKLLWYDNISVRMFIPDALDDRIQGTLLRHGRFWEESMLRKAQALITPNSYIVDVGANIGNHTIFFHKICRAKHVTSFEPQKRLALILKKNLKLNEIENSQARVIQAGCGAINSSLKMVKHRTENLGATQFCYDETGSFQVKRLDDCEVGKVDFLKIDVERLGDEVLKGAELTILTHKPIIWIELYPEGGERGRSIQWLKDAGYRVHERMTAHDFIFRPT